MNKPKRKSELEEKFLTTVVVSFAVSGVGLFLCLSAYLFMVIGTLLFQHEKDVRVATLVFASALISSTAIMRFYPEQKNAALEDEHEDDTTDESLVTVLERSFYTESYMQSLLKEKEEYQRLYNLTLDELNKRKKTQD